MPVVLPTTVFTSGVNVWDNESRKEAMWVLLNENTGGATELRRTFNIGLARHPIHSAHDATWPERTRCCWLVTERGVWL